MKIQFKKIIESTKKKFHKNKVLVYHNDTVKTNHFKIHSVKENGFGYYIKDGYGLLFLNKDGTCSYFPSSYSSSNSYSSWKIINVDSDFKNWMLGKTYKCNCKVCEYSKNIEIIRNNGTREELQKLINDLHNIIGEAETKADYWKLKYQNQWPK